MTKNIQACISQIKKLGLDAILVSDPTNISYLTNFSQPEGYLLLTTLKEPIYFTNPLYQAEAQKIKICKTVISNGNIFELVSEEVINLGLKNVGFEAKHLPFLEHQKIKESLTVQDINFIETIDLVGNLRAIKSPQEIALIKKSIQVSLEAFDFIEDIYDERMSEKDLSIEIERFLKLKGDNQLAFAPIVAAGKNAAFAHHKATEGKINRRICLIDLGSKYYGYCADLTRVFFWGKMPPSFKRLYDIVLKAQSLSIKKIKDGIKACDVDKAARDYIEKKGFGKNFIHGIGHGIGLSVHEAPFLNRTNTAVLKEGMVVTIEPAVYIQGKFGIRIEDMVLVRKNKGEILSSSGNR